jgi:cysteine desulfurase/selenocysteine lyase
VSLIPKSEFLGLDAVAHLCAGGEAPWLRSHDAATHRFGALKSRGMAGREEIFAVYARAKQGVAHLLGVGPERVALLGSASDGVNQAVAAIDWRAGDNVVAGRLEYPSLLYPVARLRERGIEVRLVEMPDHQLSLDALGSRVDGRTRLVLVSQVSYVTGQQIDVARCAEIARGAGARLLVDATHALGVAPVAGALADFVVSSAYKWLLATHGIGVFAFDPARVGEIRPAAVGWHSVSVRGGPADPLRLDLRPDATRLEPGNPGLLAAFVLENALARLAALDPSAVLEHVLDLGDELLAGLAARGLRPTTPWARAARAGNVCFLHPDAAGLAARLGARGVLVWGSEGRIRVSVHCYNDAGDVRAFLEALDAEA